MITIRKLADLTAKERDGLLYRFGDDFTDIMMRTVAPIVNDVRARGDEAVLGYNESFDRVRMDALMATRDEIEAGFRGVPDQVLEAFDTARLNIEEFHSRQFPSNIHYEREDGSVLGVAFQPIGRVAVYVPGGKACYPSSVLMGVIPAQIAGCGQITLVTPPGPDGKVPVPVAAVCRLLGVYDIIKAGGAQGIAAAGFGTQTAPRADLIVGPGNIYVTAAKTYLFSLGVVQIDSLAGPSEVLIVADGGQNPRWVAWDLLSQAEHDEMAAAILITPSEELAVAVQKEIEKDLASGRGRHAIKRTSIDNNGLILITSGMDEAIEFANAYGPEHMELMTDNALEYVPRIRNVGSLFLGAHSPVAVGDYFSGTNHILPTGGASRFSSGTSVETFMRRTTYQRVSREGLSKARGPVGIMSRVEGFEDKHGGSLEVRFEKDRS